MANETSAAIAGELPMTTPATGLDRFEALLSARGRELLRLLAEQDPSPLDALRTASALRVSYPADLVADALTQHELRQRARAKFSRAGEMFFTRDGLEQASSEVIARYRARRIAGFALAASGPAAAARAARVADLCCGIGGDLIALSSEGTDVLAVDVDPLHLRMARENAAAYQVAGAVTTVNSDVRDAGLAGVSAVFIDPARRAGGRRLRPGTSEPPLPWCLALADRVPATAIKAAPGLAHEDIPPGWEVEFIAIGRDLKEAVAWSPALATTSRRATILPASAGPAHTMVAATSQPPAPPVPVRPAGEYLCDPSPAVTRAGLVEELARDLGAWKIDDRIAFLSADAPLRTPFGRSLRVVDSGPWNEKRLSARLRELGVGAVDIRRRGLAGDVEAVHRRLKLTGSGRATLVMTRAQDRPWALICVDSS